MIWFLLACGGDPESLAERRAILGFREGKELLDTSPERALVAFQRAQSHRPNDPLLRGWESMALARMGELNQALEITEGLIAEDPLFAEARYNRAAWLARAGRPGEAGPELRRALELRAARDREAMQDADFIPYLGHPAFGFLPEEVLTVVVEAPTETVFWGSEVSLRFRVLGTSGNDVQIHTESSSGPLKLLMVREDEHESSEGLARDIRYTFRVGGAGDVVLGPFEIHSGPWSSRVNPVRFSAEAPPGKVFTGEPLPFITPSVLRAGWSCEARGCVDVPASPLIRRTAHGFQVLTRPGSRVQGASSVDIRYDFSVDGRPRWTLWDYRMEVPDRGIEVEVREGRGAAVSLSLP